MQPPAQLAVTVRHDAAAGVWYVHESDLPGLHAEGPTLDALVAAIEAVVPDLIEANLPPSADGAPQAVAVCVQHVVRPRPARAA